jgi:ZIP family zinc transporter
VGLSIVSRFLHHYIPSHVEHCGPDEDDHKEGSPEAFIHGHDGNESRRNSENIRGRARGNSQLDGASASRPTEESPLLIEHGVPKRPALQINGSKKSKSHRGKKSRSRSKDKDGRRPSMLEVPARVMSFVKDTKTNCDEDGRCYGYTEPCGQECFKHMVKTPTTPRHQSLIRANTRIIEEDETDATIAVRSSSPSPARPHTHEAMEEGCEDEESQHHHHVAENTFMSYTNYRKDSSPTPPTMRTPGWVSPSLWHSSSTTSPKASCLLFPSTSL